MRILLVTSEMAPLAKTGGLADVSQALPKALAGLGHEVAVALPFYGSIREGGLKARKILPEVVVDLPAGIRSAAVWRASVPSARPDNPLSVYLIDDPGLFDRPGLYAGQGGEYPDNALRFGYFCLAAAWMLKGLGWRPDAIIANDWQASLISINRRWHPAVSADPWLASIPVLLSIHNISYQGIYPDYLLEHLGLPKSAFHIDGLEFHGSLNLLKGAIMTSDWITTVSPTYAREIQSPELGFGLDGAIRSRGDRLRGILNGIDVEAWDPAADPTLPARYDASDLTGKQICKQRLQQRFGLPAEPRRPLIGMVGRLVEQKGFDLVLEALPELLRGQNQVVVLGTGDPRYEDVLRAMARRSPRKLGVRIGFDEPLARLIEAGADMFLMPSLFEPCGLNQLYSLRYGTAPIVRRTGGLADTVLNATPARLASGKATGFVFTQYTARHMCAAIRRALRLYRNDPAAWRKLILTGMEQDFSWTRSAKEYVGVLTKVRK